MKSKRQNKINQIISEELSKIFRRQCIESPIKQVIIFITSTNVNSNLTICKIHLSIYPREHCNKIFNEIKENIKIYNIYLADKLGKALRIIPNLIFFLDISVDNYIRIENELKGLGKNPVL